MSVTGWAHLWVPGCTRHGTPGSKRFDAARVKATPARGSGTATDTRCPPGAAPTRALWSGHDRRPYRTGRPRPRRRRPAAAPAARGRPHAGRLGRRRPSPDTPAPGARRRPARTRSLTFRDLDPVPGDRGHRGGPGGVRSPRRAPGRTLTRRDDRGAVRAGPPGGHARRGEPRRIRVGPPRPVRGPRPGLCRRTSRPGQEVGDGHAAGRPAAPRRPADPARPAARPVRTTRRSVRAVGDGTAAVRASHTGRTAGVEAAARARARDAGGHRLARPVRPLRADGPPAAARARAPPDAPGAGQGSGSTT